MHYLRQKAYEECLSQAQIQTAKLQLLFCIALFIIPKTGTSCPGLFVATTTKDDSNIFAIGAFSINVAHDLLAMLPSYKISSTQASGF